MFGTCERMVTVWIGGGRVTGLKLTEKIEMQFGTTKKWSCNRDGRVTGVVGHWGFTVFSNGLWVYGKKGTGKKGTGKKGTEKKVREKKVHGKKGKGNKGTRKKRYGKKRYRQNRY